MKPKIMKKFYQIQDCIKPPIVKKYSVGEMSYQDSRPYLKCKDGFTISCQASETHYCTPRENGLPAKKYESWELGFPSEHDVLIEEYAEGHGWDTELDYTQTVYGWVPTAIIYQLIEKHGGLI